MEKAQNDKQEKVVEEINELIESIDGEKGKDLDNEDDEFHDANDEHSSDELETKFSDALDLDAPVDDETLTDEELLANKEKSDSLKNDGNSAFKANDYNKSIELYSEALKLCPKKFAYDRSVLFGNRAAAHIYVESKTMAIEDCNRSLELNPNYVKALVRRARLYEETDKLEESLADFKKILEHDANNGEARASITRLSQRIEERNEKLKEEMMGKLKDLGNLVLKPFGLSTNNFQLQQDPTTGSYSVNFNQSPSK